MRNARCSRTGACLAYFIPALHGPGQLLAQATVYPDCAPDLKAVFET